MIDCTLQYNSTIEESGRGVRKAGDDNTYSKYPWVPMDLGSDCSKLPGEVCKNRQSSPGDVEIRLLYFVEADRNSVREIQIFASSRIGTEPNYPLRHKFR